MGPKPPQQDFRLAYPWHPPAPPERASVFRIDCHVKQDEVKGKCRKKISTTSVFMFVLTILK
jgi:hypothetical protein